MNKNDKKMHMLFNYQNAGLHIKMACLEKCFTPMSETSNSCELSNDEMSCLQKCDHRIKDFYSITREVYKDMKNNK